MAKSAARLKVIRDISEIPEFQTEADEADFWGTHTMSDDLWNSLPPVEDELPAPGTALGSTVVLPPDLSERLRHLAKRKGADYVALARSFVAERLYEEEKREGIIGDSKAS